VLGEKREVLTKYMKENRKYHDKKERERTRKAFEKR